MCGGTFAFTCIPRNKTWCCARLWKTVVLHDPELDLFFLAFVFSSLSLGTLGPVLASESHIVFFAPSLVQNRRLPFPTRRAILHLKEAAPFASTFRFPSLLHFLLASASQTTRRWEPVIIGRRDFALSTGLDILATTEHKEFTIPTWRILSILQPQLLFNPSLISTGRWFEDRRVAHHHQPGATTSQSRL